MDLERSDPLTSTALGGHSTAPWAGEACHRPRSLDEPPAAAKLPTDTTTPPCVATAAWRRMSAAAGIPYYLYLPPSFAPGCPLLVTVHGISRNAAEHVRRFAPYAERYGVAVLAPLFERLRFPRYQRLTPAGTGEPPDGLLDRLVHEIAADTGAGDGRLHLFGYSGGGQFVHRYVLAHPRRVARYVVGAAGWYTFPDPCRRYPYGLRQGAERIGGSFRPDEFLAVPGCVLVGERDVAQGTAMRVNDRLIVQQGGSRLERAARWVAAMNETARGHGLEPPLMLEVLPRSPHSFARSMRRGHMGERVFRFLFGEPRATPR